MAIRVEDGVEIHDIRVRNLPGRINVIGPHGPIMSTDLYPPLVLQRPNIPVPENRRILTKDEIKSLRAYSVFSGRELAIRTGTEWTTQFDHDSLSTQTDIFQADEPKAEFDFRKATRDFLEQGIEPWMLKEKLRESSVVRQHEGVKMSEIDETVLFEIEVMKQEIDDIAVQLKQL